MGTKRTHGDDTPTDTTRNFSFCTERGERRCEGGGGVVLPARRPSLPTLLRRGGAEDERQRTPEVTEVALLYC